MDYKNDLSVACLFILLTVSLEGENFHFNADQLIDLSIFFDDLFF